MKKVKPKKNRCLVCNYPIVGIKAGQAMEFYNGYVCWFCQEKIYSAWRAEP